jgi:DNA-directed RNA polymerase sigma subunit (sigma70/sigma32)
MTDNTKGVDLNTYHMWERVHEIKRTVLYSENTKRVPLPLL